jgi:hypothetical protein
MFRMLKFDYMKKLTLLLLLFLALTCPAFADDEALTVAPTPAVVMPANIAATPEFQAVQTQIMNNPDILGDIQKLMEDPEVMTIISDPEFIAAIQSGDPAAIGSNPRLQRLAENPKIQALMQKIQSQQ